MIAGKVEFNRIMATAQVYLSNEQTRLECDQIERRQEKIERMKTRLHNGEL
jgi:hypothetical protein